MIGRALEQAAVALAARSSRRSFLGSVGRGFVALVGGPVVAVALSPGRAEAFHVCGHLYSTGSCPHPFAPLTRIDNGGYPLHPRYGYPVDDYGDIYTSRDQQRSKICEQVVPARYPYVRNPGYGGGWSRCCNGRVRHISDCCSYSTRRINGDRSVRGYCHGGKRVFCIAYRDTNVRC